MSDLKKGVDFSQLAYSEFIEEGYKKLEEQGVQKPYSIKQLIETTINVNDAKLMAIEKGYNPNAMSFKELATFSNLSQEDIERLKLMDNEVMDYKVWNVHDANDKNGYYGCLIQTDPETITFCERGSERGDFTKWLNDWPLNNYASLGSLGTRQQDEAEQHYEEVKPILARFSKIQTAGHSLGACNAAHLAVVMAEDKTSNNFEKLDKVYDIDGQGFSKNYLEKHEEAARKAGSKIDHYKFSLVGDLLFPIPGENEIYIESKEDSSMPLIKRLIYRHDTKNIIYDENGEPVPANGRDKLAKIVGPLSRCIDSRMFVRVMGKITDMARRGIGSLSDIGAELVAGDEPRSAFADVFGMIACDNTVNKESVLDISSIFREKEQDLSLTY